MTELKFSLDSFRQLDLPELLISIWDYAYHIIEKECIVCQTYQGWCIVAAREKWLYSYINFDFVIDNSQKQNRNWVDFGNFSTETKNQICYHILKEKNRLFKISYT